MTEYSIAFIGMGRVAAAVWTQLEERSGDWAQSGWRFRVTGVATRRGIVADPAGIPQEEWLARKAKVRPVAPQEILNWVRTRPADILIELSPLNPINGRPALDYLEAALQQGMHAVTANKGPQVFGFRKLDELARSRQVGYRFESAVLDGAPIFHIPGAMPACRLRGFEGILNSTCNYILDEMDQGRPLDEALLEAQKAGITEANAAWDIEGWDAKIKTCLLANTLLGLDLRPAQVESEGIQSWSLSEVAAVRAAGEVLRLVARGDVRSGRFSVHPERFRRDHLFAAVRGASTILTLEFDDYGPISLLAPHPTLRQTAYGVINDLLAIAAGHLWPLPQPASASVGA